MSLSFFLHDVLPEAVLTVVMFAVAIRNHQLNLREVRRIEAATPWKVERAKDRAYNIDETWQAHRAEAAAQAQLLHDRSIIELAERIERGNKRLLAAIGLASTTGGAS